MTQEPSQPASLNKRAVSSASWVMVSSLVGILVSFVSSIIMTRFLPPEAFGMIAVAAVLQAFALISTDIGIIQSIVRESDGEKARFLQVAWTVQLIRSGAIAGIVLVIAVGLHFGHEYFVRPESVMADPALPLLVAAFAGIAFLDGAISANWHLAGRRLQIGQVSLIQLSAQIVGLVGAVAFVQFYPTFWALFVGVFLTSLTKTGLSHLILQGPRMKIVFDREISGRLWAFGKWILGASVLNYIAGQADRLILGGGLAGNVFGVYTLSRNLLDAGDKLLTALNKQVGYAVLAEVRNKTPDQIKPVFRKCDRAMTGLCFVGTIFTVFLAIPVINLIYPETFAQAGIYLQLMAPSLLLRRYLMHTQLILAEGNSRVIAINTGIRAMAVCTVFPVALAHLGVEAALVVAILARNAAVPYVFYLTGKILGRRQFMIDLAWYCAIVSLLGVLYLNATGRLF